MAKTSRSRFSASVGSPATSILSLDAHRAFPNGPTRVGLNELPRGATTAAQQEHQRIQSQPRSREHHAGRFRDHIAR